MKSILKAALCRLRKVPSTEQTGRTCGCRVACADDDLSRYFVWRPTLSSCGHSHPVWLNFRFPLSLRPVEEMLAEHSIVVSRELSRRRGMKFGGACAAEFRRRSAGGDTRHLDGVVSSGARASKVGTPAPLPCRCPQPSAPQGRPPSRLPAARPALRVPPRRPAAALPRAPPGAPPR